MAFEPIKIQDVSGSQMIEIPDNFKINDDKVYLKKAGNTLFIIPFHKPWQSLMDSLDEFSEDFMEEREQPLVQSRNFFDK